jgi:3-dehydrosphinganine reductase
MIARRKGYIVNFSSVLGFVASFGYTAYCAAKFGVRGFTDALRHELKPYGIHVSCVFPQDTDTPQLHQEREMQPPEARRISEGANRVLEAGKVARIIVRNMALRKKYILPGLKIKVFFPVLDGPRVLSRFFGWYFVDRIVKRVRRDLGLDHEGEDLPEEEG